MTSTKVNTKNIVAFVFCNDTRSWDSCFHTICLNLNFKIFSLENYRCSKCKKI